MEEIMKLLIIEDDDKLRTELARFFSMEGYETEELTDYENLEESVLKAHGDLLLLDIGLPVNDGKFLCRSLRKKTSLPIVIITSQDTEMNELLCMNYGADDFMAKPFNPQILLAHVEAVLKRTMAGNRESRSTIGDGRQEAELTKNESRILFSLARNRGKILSRDQIMNDLWDSELFVDDNTLTVNMTRLRAKLELLGKAQAIKTKRGQGYLLE